MVRAGGTEDADWVERSQVASSNGASAAGDVDTSPALTGSGDPLVQVKLRVPGVRLGTLNRVSLGGLTAAQRPVVVAVSTPAGYGKTTLLVEWARCDRRKVAWVSLDRADNDPVVLATSLAFASHSLCPIDSAVFDDLASPGVSILGRVVPRVAASLALSVEPFLLIVDDLHEVDAQVCRDALNLLADHLPAGSTLAVSSRGDVWLNLARRRARGDVLEVGPGQLAFDADEASQLLAGAGVELGAEAVGELLRRTEGWPAGLYLAALALRDGPSGADMPDLLAGDDRFIADYLRFEILDRAPEADRQFLIRTAVLDQLCGSLCDHTLGRRGSAEMLASLERSNLFLVALDHRRQWYRYHGLFRDLLRAELARSEPELEPELHRRAADWYEANGRPEAAIDHARAGEETERAARLVAGCVLLAYASGHLTMAQRWLADLTAADIEHYPSLGVLAGWIFAFTGQPIEAARWADAAERGSFTGVPPDGSASIESARAILRAAMCPRGVAAMMADAESAVAAEPPWSPWRGPALMLLFSARRWAGDIVGAETVLDELVETDETTNDTTLSYALTERSLLAMDRGDWDGAAGDLERARANITSLRRQEYVMSAITYAASARFAIHQQDLASAREQLAHGMRLRPQATWALPFMAVELRLELGRVCLALADPAGARTLLREIEQILQRRPDLGVLNWQADHLRHQLAGLPTGRVGVSALTAAELRLLPYLQTHLTYREVGQRLFLSPNTIKTEAKSLYRKLDVSSRDGAVERARQLGLLAG